ncbi:hypothetical protein [Hymenobacter jeollabukensis]|uniref:G-D-S-L family lipolytic protein n=1 Tax=Hymenobacter jeollabukensis TaxID=2025313 RepID=A0A5R8WV24_9BACT|nr:hypothetical protein [Hymenobacter jeollabukensis]TLM95343.1 hypothetical protein FDY95_06020 [Hymenobacter jeollabukensis]
MNTLQKYSSSALLLGLGLAGCQPEMHSPKYDRGTADFSKYVAVGNSLTAGFSDGGLYLEGQVYSYPNILSQQFAKVGGGPFTQPLFSDAQSNGSGYLRLAGFTTATPPDEPSPITANVTTGLAVRGFYTPPRQTTPIPLQMPPRPLYTKITDFNINNLGVPGIRLSDIETVGYGSQAGNPYFERITPDAQATQTYLARVTASNPTFFSNWLGNNDVLGYATAGGYSSFITSPTDFADKNSKVIDALTAGGAKGIVATIPDVTNVPYFTTVGPRFRAQLTRLGSTGFVALTGAGSTRKLIARDDIRNDTGGRQLLTLTSSPYLGLLGTVGGRYWRELAISQLRNPTTGAVNQLDYQTLLGALIRTAAVDTTKAFGTPENPLPSALILDDEEQQQVLTATAAFNTAIRSKAASKGLAVFDSNAFFSGVAQSGFITNGVNNTASFITGNLFSLDGVHPTPRGYAVIANEMIKAINAQYGSTIPFVNPNAYRGVRIP